MIPARRMCESARTSVATRRPTATARRLTLDTSDSSTIATLSRKLINRLICFSDTVSAAAAMNLDDTPSQAEFRTRARAWLAEHRHESPRPIAGLHVDDPAPYREWQGKLAHAGLVGVTWPVQFGGGGLGPSEEMIAGDEIARAGCAQIVDHIAIGELGPTLIAYGTAEQKERYVGPMLYGTEGWCQLFSEPGAGSDLAGISTRARVSDDGWVLNGQKVWTTLAQFAEYGLLLARTDPDVPKHKGLTMFVVPMDAPGVTVRPLRLMSGSAPFNEVFFDDVRLAPDAVVGPVDSGWGVSITTLMFERLMALSAFEHLSPSPEELIAPLLDSPALANGDIRRRIAELTVDRLALRYTAYRALSDLEDGRMPGPEAGLGKIGVVEAGRKAAALIAETLGPDALEGQWGELAAEMPGMRSAGGTEEILRNTIGERVLGLPSEPRLDKDRPFSELTRT
jgi:alkylation response protein AidB-like acyl-CoA dehydrogenase